MRFYTVDPACEPVSILTRAAIVFLQLYFLCILTAVALAAFAVSALGALVIFFANSPLWALGGSTVATAGIIVMWLLLRVLRQGPLDIHITMNDPDLKWFQIVEKETVQ